MIKILRQYFTMPLLLFFSLLFDGSFMNVLSSLLKGVNYQIVPAFTLISIVLLSLYMRNKRFILITAIIIGCLYDIYYTSILGVNIFLFPLAVVSTQYVVKRMPINFYSIWFWTIISYLMYGHIQYLLFKLINIHDQPYLLFIMNSLIPSLLFNAVFVFICNWYVVKIVHSMEKLEIDDNK